MQIDIITAFPSLVNEPLQQSIIKRAQNNNIVSINVHNLRDWAKDRHKTIDDTPYGGGAGMVFKVEPLYDCLSDVAKKDEEKAHEYYHLTTEQAASLAQQGVVKKLILTHFSQRYKNVKELEDEARIIFPNTVAAHDFLKVKV